MTSTSCLCYKIKCVYLSRNKNCLEDLFAYILVTLKFIGRLGNDYKNHPVTKTGLATRKTLILNSSYKNCVSLRDSKNTGTHHSYQGKRHYYARDFIPIDVLQLKSFA